MMFFAGLICGFLGAIAMLACVGAIIGKRSGML